MKPPALLLAAVLWGLAAGAGGAHITDRLLAGLYEAPHAEQEPKGLLESGTPVEELERRAGFVRVRLSSGTTGWVRSQYVTHEKPAKARLLELQARTAAIKGRLAATEQALERSKARLQEARTRSPELERGVDPGEATAMAAPSAGPGAAVAAVSANRSAEAAGATGGAAGAQTQGAPSAGVGLPHYLALGGAALVGFAAGLAWFDYRLRKRFGGFRV